MPEITAACSCSGPSSASTVAVCSGGMGTGVSAIIPGPGACGVANSLRSTSSMSVSNSHINIMSSDEGSSLESSPSNAMNRHGNDVMCPFQESSEFSLETSLETELNKIIPPIRSELNADPSCSK